jgi:hypothetical protein
MRTSTICTAANFFSALRGESECEGFELPSERHVQAMREEGDEHVCLDACGLLMEDRADRQIALQGAERLFDCPSCR